MTVTARERNTRQLATGTVRAVLYLRVSENRAKDADGISRKATLEDDHLATDRQRKMAKALAKARGWIIVGEYSDELTASDRRKARPGYDAMVRAYLNGEFDALICYDLDRLTRQPRQGEDWIEWAEERGLVVVTSNGEADLSTDAGQLFARLKFAVARGEIQRKGKRQRDAGQQAAELGRVPRNRSFGYHKDGTPHPVEAPVVVALYDKFLGGASLRSLTQWLNDHGHTTARGNAWERNSVRVLLGNPRNAALRTYQRTVVGPGHWAPLVSEETWSAAVALIGTNADPDKGNARKWVGTNLYRCHCGLLCATGYDGTNGSRRRSYRCSGPTGHMARHAGNVDGVVFEFMESYLANPKLADRLAPADAQSAGPRAEVKRLRQRLANLERDQVDDPDPLPLPMFKRMVRDVQTKLEAATIELAKCTSANVVARAVASGDPVAYWKAADVSTQRAMIAAVCTVTLLPVAKRGRVAFDPELVDIETVDQ